MTKKFRVTFLEEIGRKGYPGFYVKTIDIFLTLGDRADKTDVLNAIIRAGYRGEVLNITEVKK